MVALKYEISIDDIVNIESGKLPSYDMVNESSVTQLTISF
jgi:hypothetical protein